MQPKMGVCWEPAGLPKMIWSQIVNKMNVREYARVAGTCKVFSDLQPDVPNFCVDSNSTVEGMLPGLLVCCRAYIPLLVDICNVPEELQIREYVDAVPFPACIAAVNS